MTRANLTSTSASARSKGTATRPKRATATSNIVVTTGTRFIDRLGRAGTLPEAVSPLALSLNENPFPPLPAVRAALIASLDAANRYPEFLPERLRALIAAHIVSAR